MAPMILWSMNGSDPIGTIRHEAIHHLRNDGFFKPDEWATLEKASKDEGWQKKYNITDRYAKQPEDIKTEESIAEAYRHWAQESEDRLRQPEAQAIRRWIRSFKAQSNCLMRSKPVMFVA